MSINNKSNKLKFIFILYISKRIKCRGNEIRYKKTNKTNAIANDSKEDMWNIMMLCK